MQTTTSNHLRWMGVTTTLMVLAGLVGCDPTSSSDATARVPAKRPAVPAPLDDTVESEEDKLPSPVAVESGVKPWIATDQLPWEAWYLQYLDGKRIGYSHVEVNRTSLTNDDKRIRINRTDCIEVVGNGTQAIFKRTIESTEYSDGRLISMTDISQSVDNIATTEGQLVKNTFSAKTTIGEEVSTNLVAWEPGAWGLMGLQAILMQHPPQPGELLEAKVFIPQLYKIAKTELLAGQPDITTLPGGKTESLVPVDVILWTEETGMRSRNWVNGRGEVLKTISLSGPNLSTFWTTEEVAHRVRDEFELDGYLAQRVPLSGGQDLAAAKQVADKVVFGIERNAESTGVEVYSLLAKSGRQAVTSINALSAEATVRRVDPQQLDSLGDAQIDEIPNDSFLAATPLLLSDSPLIKQLAAELNGGQTTSDDAAASPAASLATALRLTRGLHEKLTETPLDRQVASPLQTLRDMRADRVEQAIMLVALLRSQQIPARVASGLAVDPDNTTQMQFAMWTEAWLEGRWIPLDATTGQVIGIDHLKILDSDLSSENPYDAILPVFRELGGLEIKVLSHE